MYGAQKHFVGAGYLSTANWIGLHSLWNFFRPVTDWESYISSEDKWSLAGMQSNSSDGLLFSSSL